MVNHHTDWWLVCVLKGVVPCGAVVEEWTLAVVSTRLGVAIEGFHYGIFGSRFGQTIIVPLDTIEQVLSLDNPTFHRLKRPPTRDTTELFVA